MVEPSEFLEGRDGLGNLSINNLRQSTNTHRVLAKTIKLAPKQILALDWGAPLVRAIWSETLGALLRELRTAGVKFGESGEFTNNLKRYIREDELKPQNYGTFGPSVQRNTNYIRP